MHSDENRETTRFTSPERDEARVRDLLDLIENITEQTSDEAHDQTGGVTQELQFARQALKRALGK